MGSCCFTPTSRDFLWWYWLLLVSIVGIPILLAVRYVAKSGGTEAQRREAGKEAARIFWTAAVLMVLVLFFVMSAVTEVLYGLGGGSPTDSWSRSPMRGYVYLVMGFLFSLVAADLCYARVSKVEPGRRLKRVLVALAFMAAYVGLVALYGEYIVGPQHFLFSEAPSLHDLLVTSPTVLHVCHAFLTFLICLPIAHCWQRFKDDPLPGSARRAAAAFVAGATSCFLVTRYGQLILSGVLWPFLSS